MTLASPRAAQRPDLCTCELCSQVLIISIKSRCTTSGHLLVSRPLPLALLTQVPLGRRPGRIPLPRGTTSRSSFPRWPLRVPRGRGRCHTYGEVEPQHHQPLLSRAMCSAAQEARHLLLAMASQAALLYSLLTVSEWACDYMYPQLFIYISFHSYL